MVKAEQKKTEREEEIRVFKNVVAANSRLFMGYSRVGVWESIYIAESYYSLPASAGLGLGRPEVKPSTPEPLPAG